MHTLLTESTRVTSLERRRWRRLERRIDRIDDGERLAILRALAHQTSPVGPGAARPATGRGPIVGPLELRIGGRRIGLSRVHAGTWGTLQAAIPTGDITLAGAGRYGPYWVLQFDGPGAPLAVLAERIRLLPEVAAARDFVAGPRERLAS